MLSLTRLLSAGLTPVHERSGPRGDDDTGCSDRQAQGEGGDPRAVEPPGHRDQGKSNQADRPGADVPVPEEIGGSEGGRNAQRQHEKVQEGHDSSITVCLVVAGRSSDDTVTACEALSCRRAGRGRPATHRCVMGRTDVSSHTDVADPVMAPERSETAPARKLDRCTREVLRGMLADVRQFAQETP